MEKKNCFEIKAFFDPKTTQIDVLFMSPKVISAKAQGYSLKQTWPSIKLKRPMGVREKSLYVTHRKQSFKPDDNMEEGKKEQFRRKANKDPGKGKESLKV